MTEEEIVRHVDEKQICALTPEEFHHLFQGPSLSETEFEFKKAYFEESGVMYLNFKWYRGKACFYRGRIEFSEEK